MNQVNNNFHFLVNNNNTTKYLVGAIAQNNISKIENYFEIPIDDYVFEKHYNAYKLLNNYEIQNRHFLLVYLNYLEYKQTYNSLCLYLMPGQNTFDTFANMKLTIDDPLSNLHYVTLTQKIYNYLSAVRTFIDYTKIFVNSDSFGYSKGYDLNESFDIVRKKEHTNNDAYMFLYLLRNYVQHQWFPPGIVRTKRMISNNGASQTCSVSYLINRDEYLKNNADIKGENKNRILKLPDEIDVCPMIDSDYESVRRIHFELIKDQVDDLKLSVVNMKKIIIFVNNFHFTAVNLRSIAFSQDQESQLLKQINIPFYLSGVFDSDSI